MSLPSSVIDALVASGCTAEQLAAAIKAANAEAQAMEEARKGAKRASNAERQRRKRLADRHVMSRVTERDDSVTGCDTVSPKKETSPTPPKEKTTPSTTSEANASSVSLEIEFEQQFWPAYPRKVGKGQALKAFRSARKQADLEAILAGVRRYADERRGENPEFTRHASTWLSGLGWLDEPTVKRIDPPPKLGVVDAMQQIFRERGWTTDEPELVHRDNRDAEFLRSEPATGHSGVVVDLREGAGWRRG